MSIVSSPAVPVQLSGAVAAQGLDWAKDQQRPNSSKAGRFTRASPGARIHIGLRAARFCSPPGGFGVQRRMRMIALRHYTQDETVCRNCLTPASDRNLLRPANADLIVMMLSLKPGVLP